jgi:hypothetical protein
MTSARNWCFTLNNPTEEEIQHLNERASRHARYMIYQFERGAEGTRHLQGYFWGKQGYTLTRVKRRLGRRCHLEKARGTPYQNYLYCSKQETREADTEPVEFGPRPIDARSPFARVAEEIKDGKPLSEVAMENPGLYARCASGFEKLANIVTPLREVKTKCVIFFGAAGEGKTYAARRFPSPYMVPDYNRQVQYYDGYDPRLHKTVWFDDYYGDLRWRSWLQANDDTPFRVNKKGAMTVFNPEWCVYTSNAHPQEWYSKMFQSDEKRRAFERRVTL